MSHEDLIDELLEEILETGRTPEEVCAERPDLLPEVRARLRKLRAVEAQVNSLFPSLDGLGRTLASDLASGSSAVLPTIPDYEVQRVLGRGGMGIVYQARHLKLNRDVALKMLLTGSYASRQEHLRFVREAEAVAALQHPSIVQVYDIGEVEGRPYYTMEYVGGGNLADRLAGKVQPAHESATIVCKLAQAVQAAHVCGVVHRDLKPANILLDDAGAPKIADFGLARRMDRESGLTHTGARIGTPSYMAPEQLTGSSASWGPAVDVFALGAILYEMLTGRPPFRGDTLSDTERKLAFEDPAALSRFNAKVPRDLETICLKCLEKEPRSRYASAGDLAADLDRFLRHEPIHARPLAPGERWVRWIRRNPLPAALTAASIVLVALAVSKVLDERAEAAAARAERTRLTSRFQSGIELVQAGRFAEAQAILGELGDGGFDDLRNRIDRALSDLKLVDKLEAISIKRSMALDAHDAAWHPERRAAAEYEALFDSAGIGKMTDPPAAVARRVGSSDIKQTLVAALDDWAVCEADEVRRGWVLAVARDSDGQPQSWQRQFRDPFVWNDREVLEKLAKTALEVNPSVYQLRALGERMTCAGIDSAEFRTRVQAIHVDSFLANLSLADFLRNANPSEATRYYQAALAIRPRSATAHNNLAVALTKLGRSADAIVQFRQSLELDPTSTAAHFNLGVALAKTQPAEATEHLRQAMKLSPELAISYRTLAELLIEQQQFADALATLRRCLPLLSEGQDRDQVNALIERCEK